MKVTKRERLRNIKTAEAEAAPRGFTYAGADGNRSEGKGTEKAAAGLKTAEAEAAPRGFTYAGADGNRSEGKGAEKAVAELKIGGNKMHEYDDAVLACFLKKQSQLFPENVAETPEEAEAFLEDCMAVVVDSVREVWDYFEEAGIDTDGADEEEILNADEVFDIGDGRYLIVEG